MQPLSGGTSQDPHRKRDLLRSISGVRRHAGSCGRVALTGDHVLRRILQTGREHQTWECDERESDRAFQQGDFFGREIQEAASDAVDPGFDDADFGGEAGDFGAVAGDPAFPVGTFVQRDVGLESLF